MAGFYIRDLNVKKNGFTIVGIRRPLTAIQTILRLIFPQDLIIERQKTTDLGFLFFVPYDKNVNFLLHPRVQNILKENNLQGQLSNITAKSRQVFLKDIPEHIDGKSIQEITNEIQKVTNLNILDLR